jgi:DNA-binding helix-hairpin-helix protein with protein kinase domain
MNNLLKLNLGTPVNQGPDKVVIDISNPIGSGAQADVTALKIHGENFAAKIFHNPTSQVVRKVVAMIENPPSNLIIGIDGVKYPLLSWPLRLLYDSSSGLVVGYLMKLVDLKNSFTLDYFYDHNLRKKLLSPEEGALSCRLEIAGNLSEVVADLHRLGHYCIDFKPQNIRVFKSTHVVTLIDCDGFSVVDKAGFRYPAQLVSTDYIAPEATIGNLSIESLGEQQDLYALAVIIFQLLNQGLHPFQGVPRKNFDAPATNDEKAAKGLYPYGLHEHSLISPNQQSIHRCFETGIRELFDRAFSSKPNIH